jgi:hypothetical protein
MPGRGVPWRTGGHVDETIEEADLTQAVQSKLNVGGGGGKQVYVQGVPRSNTGGSPRHMGIWLGDFSTVEVEPEISAPLSGTIKSLGIRVRPTNTTSGSSVFTVRLNNVDTALVLTVGAGLLGTFLQETDVVFSAGDLLGVRFNPSAGNIKFMTTCTIEWD